MLEGFITNNKLVNSKITIANIDVPLGGSISLSDLGLSSALRFKGITTTVMTNGRTIADIIIDNSSYTPIQGDVILYEDGEYVWTGTAWEEFGRENSFKIKQTAITKPVNTTNKWVSAIGQNVNGDIDVSYTSLDTSGTWSGNAISASKLSNITKIGDTNHPVYFTASGVPAAVTLTSTANNLLSSLPDNWTANPTDSTVLIRKDNSGADSFGQVTFETVWNYIQNKMISEGTNYFTYLNAATSDNSNTTFYIHTNIKLVTDYQRIAGELIGTGNAYHSGILSYSLYAKKTGFGTCYYVDFYNKLNADIEAYVDDNDYLHIAITPKVAVYTQWYLNCFVGSSAKNKIESVDQTAPTIVQSKELNKLTKSITYTPVGTNKKSEVTIKPVTTNIYSMTSAGSVTAGTTPTLTMSVDDLTETLSFAWDAGTSTAVTLPGRSSAIAAWTGYTSGVNNTYAAAQEFTGTQATITI